MSNKDRRPLGADSDSNNEKMTDRDLSELYHHSMRSVETSSNIDKSILALASKKADSIQQKNSLSNIPFFGSEAFRGWTGAASFGVVGVCLWVVLQTPPDQFDSAEVPAALWESGDASAKSGEPEDYADDQSPLELPQRSSEPEIKDSSSLELESMESLPFSVPSRRDQDVITGEQRRLKAEANRVQDQAAVKKRMEEYSSNAADNTAPMENSPRLKSIVTKRRASESQQSGPLRHEMKRSVEPTPPAIVEMRSAAPSMWNYSSGSEAEESVGLEADERHVEELLKVDRKQQFETQLKVLGEQIRLQRWDEALLMYEQLLEQYSDFEIPALILEQLEPHRVNAPSEQAEPSP